MKEGDRAGARPPAKGSGGRGIVRPRPRIKGLIILLWGLPFLLYGYRFARELLFPCGYLFLAIPLNFIDSMTAPLRLFATAASAFLLNGLGLKVVRVGAGLYSGAGNPFAFNVAPECSGLHSLLAMTALMAFYAWYDPVDGGAHVWDEARKSCKEREAEGVMHAENA